jgi:hypothetical protein
MLVEYQLLHNLTDMPHLDIFGVIDDAEFIFDGFNPEKIELHTTIGETDASVGFKAYDNFSHLYLCEYLIDQYQTSEQYSWALAKCNREDKNRLTSV